MGNLEAERAFLGIVMIVVGFVATWFCSTSGRVNTTIVGIAGLIIIAGGVIVIVFAVTHGNHKT